MDHSTMDHGAADSAALTDDRAVQGYAAAMDGMMQAMDAPYTGDADVDFMRGMIPLHQAAVDMARVVLEPGQDPEVRAPAEQVVASQGAEIAWMKDRLAKRGHSRERPRTPRVEPRKPVAGGSR